MTTHILPCPTHHNRQIDLAGKHSLCSPHLWNQFAGCYTSYQRQQCQTVSNEHWRHSCFNEGTSFADNSISEELLWREALAKTITLTFTAWVSLHIRLDFLQNGYDSGGILCLKLYQPQLNWSQITGLSITGLNIGPQYQSVHLNVILKYSILLLPFNPAMCHQWLPASPILSTDRHCARYIFVYMDQGCPIAEIFSHLYSKTQTALFWFWTLWHTIIISISLSLPLSPLLLLTSI